jgi:rhamnosyltransferase
MSRPAASVIVRTFDSAATVVACIESVRSQDVPSEIIVVDSGSTDGTLGLVADRVDRVEHVSRDGFSYGGALNVGADAATAPVHVALSSHCVLPRTDWLRIAAGHVQAGAAAVVGLPHDAEGHTLTEPFLAEHRYVMAHQHWGFSNHASAWDAEVWRRNPFDETLTATEDKEWSWRALAGCGPLVVDPRLIVPGEHRRSRGLRPYFKRLVKEIRSVEHLRPTPAYGVTSALADWVRARPRDRYISNARRLGRTRLVEVTARWVAGHGHSGRVRTRSLPDRPPAGAQEKGTP